MGLGLDQGRLSLPTEGVRPHLFAFKQVLDGYDQSESYRQWNHRSHRHFRQTFRHEEVIDGEDCGLD